ncbi:MAG TPA: hypothetical protein VHN82_00815 [Methanoregula sp.]|nr:hypothetical protein [Methanoregula sp.]
MRPKTLVIIGILLVVLILAISPVSAYMATLTGSSGVSRGDGSGNIFEAKDSWKKSEFRQGDYEKNYIVAWADIAPGSFLFKKCNNNLNYRWRIVTPDGKDYYRLNDPNYGYKTKDGHYLNYGTGYIWNDKRVYESLDPYILMQTATNGGASWQGKWTLEFYFENAPDSCDWSQEDYTLVNTQTFTLVDDSTAKTTTSAATTPASPSYGVTTTPPAAQGHAVSISAMDYTDASVQKTGASWDSTAEKCPTWRGSDWSGTGDYYLSRGGDTLTYSLDIPVSGVYYLWMRDWSDTNHDKGDRQVTITIDGKTLGTFDAAASFNDGTTGYGWDKLTNIDLSAGSHAVKITKTATTSSAAIIDSLYFTPQSRDVPQGAIGHSESLCSGGTRSVTTQQTGMTYPVCTPPACKSGQTYVCLQQDNCPGGCGMSCSPAPTTTARSGIETDLIIIAIIAGILLVGKQRG